MFPAEIYFEILLRLPVKSACVCKCVSKNWLNLISSPSFVKSHLHLAIQTNNPSLILESSNQKVIYSISHDSLPSLLSGDIDFVEYAVEMDYPFKSFLYDSVELVGCCGGLVCLWFWYYDCSANFFCLWNPATKEYKKLPKSPDVHHIRGFNMFGLGYDCNSGDYKLVTCCFDGVVEVYSLGMNSWTSIEDVSYEFPSAGFGVLVNGDLHWLAQAQDCPEVVVCLDIRNHVFKEIQLPNDLPNDPFVYKNGNQEFTTVGALEGYLCVLVSTINVHYEVWVMQDYGVRESWTKRYVINHERIANDQFLRLMWSFKSGELLFVLESSDNVAIYDPKDESVRKPNVPSLTQLYQEGCYYESLVSLRSGTYVGKEDRFRRIIRSRR